MTPEFARYEAVMGAVLATRQSGVVGWEARCNAEIEALWAKVGALCAAAKADGWDPAVAGAPGWTAAREAESRDLDIQKAVWRWAKDALGEWWTAKVVEGIGTVFFYDGDGQWPRVARFTPLSAAECDALMAHEVNEWVDGASAKALATWVNQVEVELADMPADRDIVAATSTPLGGVLAKPRRGRGYAEWLAMHAVRAATAARAA